MRWRKRSHGFEFSDDESTGVQCPNCDDVELQFVSPRTDGRRDYYEPRRWCPQCDYSERVEQTKSIKASETNRLKLKRVAPGRYVSADGRWEVQQIVYPNRKRWIWTTTNPAFNRVGGDDLFFTLADATAALQEAIDNPEQFPDVALLMKRPAVKASMLSAKYVNDKTAVCVHCRKALVASAVSRNPNHVYQLGITYACPCGVSKLWCNSIRDERRFVDFLMGRDDIANRTVRYTNGFCNDKYDGVSLQETRVIRNGATVAGLPHSVDLVGDPGRPEGHVAYSLQNEDDEGDTASIVEFYRTHMDDVLRQLSPWAVRALAKAGTPISAAISDAPKRSRYKKTWLQVVSAPRNKGEAWVAQVAFRWREGPNTGKIARQMVTLPTKFAAYISSGKLMIKPSGEPAYAWGTKTAKVSEQPDDAASKTWSEARKQATAAAKQYYAECKATKITGSEGEMRIAAARRSVVQYNRARALKSLSAGLSTMTGKQLAQHAVDMRFLIANVIDSSDADTLRMYKARLAATDQRLLDVTH